MAYDPERHHRHSMRLRGFDYTRAGAYFVTSCTHQRVRLFGEVRQGAMCLSKAGKIVEWCWHDLPNHYANIRLDAFVVMPDHIHGIILLDGTVVVGPRGGVHGLSEIIRAFKSFSARRINECCDTPGIAVWQRSYHDRIVRNDGGIHAIRHYIAANPGCWNKTRS